MQPMDDDALATEMQELPGWERREDRLVRTFKFPDFVRAFGWMSSMALIAESSNHHPEWRNVYGTVEVELSTHDAGGITERDVRMAREMNRLSGQ